MGFVGIILSIGFIIAIIFIVCFKMKEDSNDESVSILDELDHVCQEYNKKGIESQPSKIKSFDMSPVETSPIPEDILQSLYEEEAKNEKL